MSSLRIAAVIPARLHSTRLARKVLRPIAGRPMVEWVWRAAAASGLMDPVVVATDADEVAEMCRARAIPVVMTSAECASGSDRVREAARQIDADIYVNIQGDEPTIATDFFPPLLNLFARPEVEVSTLAVRCPPEEFANPNAVKVVTASGGRALYFSRATIPFDRDATGFAGYRKHLGIYAYRKAVLERFAALTPSPLEKLERLEQLRLLENGIDIYVADAPRDTIGVDTEEDLARAEALLQGIEGSQLGMTPARFAQGGKGEQIRWCCARSPFGWMIVGATARGLCRLSLAATKAEAEASLRTEFPAAELRRDASLSRLVDAALESVRDGSDPVQNQDAMKLDLRGTVFQLRVWQALRQIPRGQTRSYSQLARELGDAKATRAVARACAMNRVALLVPCHRVVGADGSLTGYRWGKERKRKLLEAEQV